MGICALAGSSRNTSRETLSWENLESDLTFLNREQSPLLLDRLNLVPREPTHLREDPFEAIYPRLLALTHQPEIMASQQMIADDLKLSNQYRRIKTEIRLLKPEHLEEGDKLSFQDDLKGIKDLLRTFIAAVDVLGYFTLMCYLANQIYSL